MKILQINNVYGVGSTGKLTKAIHHGLMSDGYSSVVIYGRGQVRKIKTCTESAATYTESLIASYQDYVVFRMEAVLYQQSKSFQL